MPAAAIAADQLAAHEVVLEPGVETSVSVVLGTSTTNDLEVFVIEAAAPVYVRTDGAVLAPRDPGSRMAPAGRSLVVDVDYGATGLGRVRLVCAARATVSVART